MLKKLLSTGSLFLFVLVATLDIWAVYSQNESLEFYVKPLIVTFLTIHYLSCISRPIFWYVLGLFFAFIGDVFLMVELPMYFTYGLAAFLLAHVFFIKVIVMERSVFTLKNTILSDLPFLALFGLLIGLIVANLGAMLLPVVVYGLTISTFGTVALVNYKQQGQPAQLWVLLGAIFFILSDSMIAINRFYKADDRYDVIIIVTYILALYLICRGVIARQKAVSA